jgi:hypothetical protein
MRAPQALTAALAAAACASAPTGGRVDPPIEVALAAPGASKDRILDLTRAWMTENFRAPPPAIQTDKTTGVLSAKAAIPYPCSGPNCTAKDDWLVPFTMRVETHEGAGRITFKDVRLTWPERSYRPSYDGPVRPYGDWEAVKARLLGLGDELQRALAEAQRR